MKNRHTYQLQRSLIRAFDEWDNIALDIHFSNRAFNVNRSSCVYVHETFYKWWVRSKEYNIQSRQANYMLRLNVLSCLKAESY